jgi:integrase/recombinase XerD
MNFLIFAKTFASLAQLVEQLIRNEQVEGSSPFGGSKKDITSHPGRHTFATTITLSKGVPIETVSRLRGHTSLVTTQIYAKVIDRKVADDMQFLM